MEQIIQQCYQPACIEVTCYFLVNSDISVKPHVWMRNITNKSKTLQINKNIQCNMHQRNKVQNVISTNNGRPGFSLSRALFRKNVWAPSPGAADPIFPGKKWRPFLVITVCQLSFLLCHPYLFSPETGDLFLLITVAFIHFNRSLGSRPFISGLLLCCKKFATPLVGALFCGAPVRPNF